MTQADDARHAYEQVQQSVQASDGLMRQVADETERIVLRSGITTISETDHQPMMQAIDTVLDRVFGANGQRAQLADLTRLIERQQMEAGLSWYQRSWDDLDARMTAQAPDLWRRVKAHIAATPPGERDRLQRVYHMLYGPQVDRQRLARSLFVDPHRTWVNGSNLRLSDRVWRNGQRVRREIDRIITTAIRDGRTRNELIRDLRRYIDPNYATLKYMKNGRIVRRSDADINRSATTAVRRLMRTEIAHANATATLATARDVPGSLGVKWRLSSSHPEYDICSELAATDDYNLGPGVYPVDQFPTMPSHPNCICCAVVMHEPRDVTRQKIVEQYRSQLGLELGT